ncbi:MAG: hypothetical protein WA414_16295 [Acidobacteriaceae bacterium]
MIVSFSGYKPPFDPAPLVRRMLDSVPQKYMAGLSTVVLSNASGLTGKRRKLRVKSRTRTVSFATARGAYHPASRGNLAWIEIFVDNALRGWEQGWWLRVPFIREHRLSDVLFHEIGHHVHFAVRPEHCEKEDVADVWKVRLQRNYTRQRHRWIGVVGQIIRPLFGAYLKRQQAKIAMRNLKSGQISRAEYLELTAKKENRRLDIL